MTDQPIHTAEQMREAILHLFEEWKCKNCGKWLHPGDDECCDDPFWGRQRDTAEKEDAIRALSIAPLPDVESADLCPALRQRARDLRDEQNGWSVITANFLDHAADLIERLAAENAALRTQSLPDAATETDAG